MWNLKISWAEVVAHTQQHDTEAEAVAAAEAMVAESAAYGFGWNHVDGSNVWQCTGIPMKIFVESA